MITEYVKDSELAREIAQVRRGRIYFNHMSVGNNILEGVTELAKGSGGLALQHVEPGTRAELPEAFFAHSTSGENGDPLSKIQAFSRAMEKSFAVAPAIALMKFCYMDFQPETDVKAVFKRYRAEITALREAHPTTTFIHVTVPLVEQERGVKSVVKAITGIKDSTARANMRREEYNEQLRAGLMGEPLFDLAALQATRPSGDREGFTRNGTEYPSLFPGYTNDGQHLNAVGRRRIGRELIRVLARLQNTARISIHQ